MNKQTTLALTLLCGLFLTAPLAAQNQAPAPEAVHPLPLVLIKSTLTAVNHGNITGNYAVLHGLGSERFRRENKPADLAATFAALRRSQIDLSPVLVSEPQLTQQPVQDAGGRLHLEGFCPLGQVNIQFHLIYDTVPAGWLIDQIAISIVPRSAQTVAQ
jgi:hypothetical protein